jgi:hypothetical protein
MNWKTIKDFENYEVSDAGLVRSIERVIYKKTGEKHYTQPTTILKHGLTKDGYPMVVLCKDGKMNTRRIHRLVLETFMPMEDSTLQVNHIDHVKDNNKLSNLEWCTNRENSIHRGKNITKASKYTGLYYIKDRNRWCARIRVNGKTISLGTYEKEEDAAKAYLNELAKI